MHIAYECNNCGLCTVSNSCPCDQCGKSDWVEYEAGYDPNTDDNKQKVAFAPKDHLTEGFNWSAGRKFDTRTEKNKYCEEHNMNQYSLSEMARKNGTERHIHGRAITYGGQKSHKSTAERRH